MRTDPDYDDVTVINASSGLASRAASMWKRCPGNWDACGSRSTLIISFAVRTVIVNRQTQARKDTANATRRSLVKFSVTSLSSHRLHHCHQCPMEKHCIMNPNRCTTQTGFMIHFTMLDCIHYDTTATTTSTTTMQTYDM